MRRRISILGATGSIGTQTVDVIQHAGGAERYDVVAVTGGENIAGLARIAQEIRADLAVTANPDRLDDLRDALGGSGITADAGPEAIDHAAARETDWTMSAIAGAAGLSPTLAAATATRHLALANKESLVCAGDLLEATLGTSGAKLLPVDSEHSAIFQAIGAEHAPISRILLTASGGPFRTWTRDQMAGATPAQAVAHPNWDMGVAISIDSATMFNKALEVIETVKLFKVTPEQVEVLVHPQSIVHSLVEFVDHAQIAHLGVPDMRSAIGFALQWPERGRLPVEPLDLTKIGALDFESPDEIRFPALRLAREVATAGGLTGAVLNGAKEAAVSAFLTEKIGFLDIATLVERTLDKIGPDAAMSGPETGLAGILNYDRLARDAVSTHIARQVG